jgi:hypothetical protein
MPSINAQNAAKEVINRIDKGEKVVMKEILGNIGYAENTQDNPKLVTDTKSYKEVTEPFIKQLEKRRQSAVDKLDETIDKAQYHQLVEAIDKFTKNIQLLSGEDTERSVIKIKGINYIIPTDPNGTHA